MNENDIKIRAERIKAKRIVAVEKAQDEVKVGLMQDISTSGIYFECDLDRAVGSEIRFAINVDLPEGHLTLDCSAEIVRIDTKDHKNFIAAKIIQSKVVL
jgi:hypothetical protein